MHMRTTLNLKSISERLEGTRAFVPLRTMYHNLFSPGVARQRLARSNFYAQFLGPGDLVFDVGANYGEYSQMFLRLGARVIAMEPNPACARILARGGSKDLTVRCEAVGDREGEITLFVGARSGHSTVSSEWMEKAVTTSGDYRWNHTINVPITTLDRLQREYGTPDFVKIDVEGYEASVFRGMSFRTRALGFEFHACALDQLDECLNLPVFERACSLNVALRDSWQFVWPEWRDKKAVLDFTARLPAGAYGDIYAIFEK
jgi:FkbM family methyltransferase